MIKRKIIIIGGGAAGLTAAITAAREGSRVIVLEHMERVGKKLLATGNGRCNLTNLEMKPEYYRCSQEAFPGQVLEHCSVAETLEFFDGVGILTKNRNGYIYPNSEQAAAVPETLRIEAERLGVRLLCNCHVKSVRRFGKGLEILTDSEILMADAVILAAGSRAAPSTGSDGSGYEIAARLGHRVITPLPALVSLRCRGRQYQALAGIRCEARLTLLADGVMQTQETGELQLTEYGISGIPTFQISRFASAALEQRQQVEVRIDFLPGQTLAETKYFLEDRIQRFSYRSCEELLLGVLNKKLAAVLIKLAGIEPGGRTKDLTKVQAERLLAMIKEYCAEVTETNSFVQAQTCCGGVDTREIDGDSLESRLVKGLYIVGELLDVDGICGGYNLQWAWSTGMIAGRNAAGTGSSAGMKAKGSSGGTVDGRAGTIGGRAGTIDGSAGQRSGCSAGRNAGKRVYGSVKSDQNASAAYGRGDKAKGSEAATDKKRRT